MRSLPQAYGSSRNKIAFRPGNRSLSDSRPVAQLVELSSPKRVVVGSSPAWPVFERRHPAFGSRYQDGGQLNILEELILAGKTGKKKTAKKTNAITRLVRETIGELRKVSWPSRQEAINLTKIVLIVLVLMSTFLYGVDLLGARLLTLAIGL